jgi:aryl-alcohol dehydrogenase-like predicted oxidoreductase
MTFGTFCDKQTSFEIMDRAYERGINFFDTAEIYPVPPSADMIGTTETIIGEWLKDRGVPRDSIIIASKVAGAANGWFVPPVRHGLTAIDRFHIKRAIEGTLKRLDTDYIDLYQMHWPDTLVPKEESLEAFDSLIKEGKVRYIGTSNDSSYGLTKALYTSYNKGYKRFESIQNNFSILNRRFLDELAEVCKGEQVSLLPYSPLAGGVLTGKYNNPDNKEGRFMQYLASDNPRVRNQAKRFLNDNTLKSVEQLLDIEKRYDMSLTTLATAWSMKFDFVASTIIGATKVEQLDDIFKAFDTKLSKELLKECDSVHNNIKYPMG